MTGVNMSNPAIALDNKLIVADRCISAFSRTFKTVDFKTGEAFPINCHSWRCPVHSKAHGKRCAVTIADDLEKTSGYQLLLVNLTTAEMTDFNELKNALKGFMERFRNKYGRAEYIKFVEGNRRQTQPHFHLIFKLFEHKFQLPADKWYKKKRNKKRSWPGDMFRFIMRAWHDAMKAAAPDKKPPTVVWCQPPRGDPAAAANYAVGYVSGSRAKKIEEEPGEWWTGRRFSYSKRWFYKPMREIWKDKLCEWFGQREDTRFFWQPIELESDVYHHIDRLTGEVKRVILDDMFQWHMLEHPKVKARRAEYQYFQDTGEFFHLIT